MTPFALTTNGWVNIGFLLFYFPATIMPNSPFKFSKNLFFAEPIRIQKQQWSGCACQSMGKRNPIGLTHGVFRSPTAEGLQEIQDFFFVELFEAQQGAPCGEDNGVPLILAAYQHDPVPLANVRF